MVGSPGNGAIAQRPYIEPHWGDSYTITFGYILQGFATGNTPTSQFTVGLGTFSNVLTAFPAVQDARSALWQVLIRPVFDLSL